MSETVKLIVTLSKGQYEALEDMKFGSIASRMIFNAVKHGTPLPKGHGRLIDADDLLLYTNVTECGYKPKVSRYQIITAPTIIEAEKGDKAE